MKWNSPLLDVVTVCLKPVDWWVAVTEAPATTAPLVSFTVPFILPLICWPKAHTENRHRIASKEIFRSATRFIALSALLKWRGISIRAPQSGVHDDCHSATLCSHRLTAVKIPVLLFLVGAGR